MGIFGKALRAARFDFSLVLYKLGIIGNTSDPVLPFLKMQTQRKIRRHELEGFYKSLEATDSVEEYKLFVSWHKRHDNLNLFELILREKPRAVVEFGSGVSTLIMALALSRIGKGKLYSVESDARWAQVVRDKLAKLNLSKFAEVEHATPRLEEFYGQVVASFEKLPDVRPDIIYVDGPDPRTVEGNVKGLTMNNLQFIILKDVLYYEWSLYVGAKIIMDGRTQNLRFLQKNLKREYRYRRRFLKNINEIHIVR